MSLTRRALLRRMGHGLLAASLPIAPRAVAQDTFPSQAIKIVVPFTPGGTADVLARIIATRLQAKYGSSVVVENRPGAAGNLGAMGVAKATPDGHTLVLGTVGIHAAYTLYRKNLGYDPANDLRPVVVLGEVPCALVVHPKQPFSTLSEFIAYAKANPDKLNFGSAGTGSSTHMVGELFQQAAGVKLRHIPYRGSSMAMNDLIGGQIEVMFELITTAAPSIREGLIRALGATSAQRSAALPEVPTMSELALPGFHGTGWFTIATASGVPDARVDRLNQDINESLRAVDLQDMWKSLALTIVGGSAEDARKFFASERDKWGKVIETANLRVD